MKLTAIFLFFKEAAFIEAALRAVYPVVDAVSGVTQYDRNFAGKPISPDSSLERYLGCPDPDNKLRLSIGRNLEHLPGKDPAAQLRNLAIQNAPPSDYYLIMDSDEIWPTDILQKAWDRVQKEQYSAYRSYSSCYFKTWNFRVVEKGEGYHPLVFLRSGFNFEIDRQINWWGPARWKEYIRLGRKPKTACFPPEWKVHHGSSVGDDNRILTKLNNYSHRDGVASDWFETVWKNFTPESKDIHYFGDKRDLYEGVQLIPTTDLPVEVRSATWPDGWIHREKT